MAEGGVPKSTIPPEPKGKKPTEPSILCDPLKHVVTGDLNSLELIFARDLVVYVMRRRIPLWDFGDRYGGPSPVTPFSFRVRNAIEHYLIKEDINIYFIFAQSFDRLPLNYHAFIVATSFAVEGVYPNVRSASDLLRVVAMFAHFAALAYKRGIRMAPYHALDGIQDLMHRYIKQRGLKPNVLCASLNNCAENLIRETSVVPI